jgi:hypothetical protein
MQGGFRATVLRTCAEQELSETERELLRQREAAGTALTAMLDQKANSLNQQVMWVGTAIGALGAQSVLRGGFGWSTTMLLAALVVLLITYNEIQSAQAPRGRPSTLARTVAALPRLRKGRLSRRVAARAPLADVGLYNPFAARDMTSEQVIAWAKQEPSKHDAQLGAQITGLARIAWDKAEHIARARTLLHIATALVVAAVLTR